MSNYRKRNKKGQYFVDKRKDPEAKMIRAMGRNLFGSSKKKSKKSKKQEISDSGGSPILSFIIRGVIMVVIIIAVVEYFT